MASVSMAERRRLYKVINVVDLGGFGSTHLKGNTTMSWFKQYATCFGLNYPEASSRRPNPRLQRCPPLPIDRSTESTALALRRHHPHAWLYVWRAPC